MAETTANVMVRCSNLHDAITAGHDTVLNQFREAFRTLDDTFEQPWCAKTGSLFPELI